MASTPSSFVTDFNEIDLSGNYFCIITPQSAASNILTQFRIKYASSYNANDRLTINVKRSIAAGAPTTIASDTFLGPQIATITNNDLYTLNYIDTPATTSSIKYYLTYQLEPTGGVPPANTIGIIQSQGNNIVLQELLGSGTANQGSTGSTGATGPSALSIALTSANLTYYPTFVGSTGLGQTGYIDTDLTYNPSTNTFTATNFNGNATSATNLAGGAGGQIPYQSAASTTALLANGVDGQVLTSQGGTSAPIWTSLFNMTPTSYSPILSDAGGNLTSTNYNIRVSEYIKIGKLVFYQGNISITSKSGLTAANNLRLSLPFTSDNTADFIQSFLIGRMNGMTTNIVSVSATITPSTDFMSFFIRTAASADATAMAVSDISATWSCRFGGMYMAI